MWSAPCSNSFQTAVHTKPLSSTMRHVAHPRQPVQSASVLQVVSLRTHSRFLGWPLGHAAAFIQSSASSSVLLRLMHASTDAIFLLSNGDA